MKQRSLQKNISENFTWPLIVGLIVTVAGGLILANLIRGEDVSIWVRVQDASTQQPIENAYVTLEFIGGGFLSVEETDSSGRARFLVNRELGGKPATLSVQADGYLPHILNIDVVPQLAPQSILLLSPTETPVPPTPTLESTTESTSSPAAASATPEVAAGTIMKGLLPGTNLQWIRVFVPGGTFEMGSWADDPDTRPVHLVTLNSYWIDQTEVTNEQFAAFLNSNGNKEEVKNSPWLDLADSSVLIEIRDGQFRSRDRRETFPVVAVNWYGANEFCKWVGGRLPTEAEWEYAARGLDGHPYPWGDLSPTCELANFTPRNSEAPCIGGKQVVNALPDGVSWIGALNMVGNVSEWVSDWYSDTYYSYLPDGIIRDPQGPNTGTQKVNRGGAWHMNELHLYTFHRHSLDPSERDNGLGFRCVQPNIQN